MKIISYTSFFFCLHTLCEVLYSCTKKEKKKVLAEYQKSNDNTAVLQMTAWTGVKCLWCATNKSDAVMFLEFECSLLAGCAHRFIVSKLSENTVKTKKKPIKAKQNNKLLSVLLPWLQSFNLSD